MKYEEAEAAIRVRCSKCGQTLHLTALLPGGLMGLRQISFDVLPCEYCLEQAWKRGYEIAKEPQETKPHQPNLV